MNYRPKIVKLEFYKTSINILNHIAVTEEKFNLNKVRLSYSLPLKSKN